MNLVQNSIITVLELLATMIIWSGIDNRIKYKKKYIMVVMLIGTIGITLNNYIGCCKNLKIFYFISLIALVSILFKISFWDSLIGFTLQMIIVPMIELIIFTILKIIGNDDLFNFSNKLIFAICLVIISFIIYYTIPLNKYFNGLIYHKNYIIILILDIFFINVVSIFLWENEPEFYQRYIVVFLILVLVWILMNILLIYQTVKLKEKGKIIKVHEEYIGVIEKLIDDIRSRQHDFNNHMQIIGGIVEKNDDIHIKEQLTDYLGGLNYSLKGINGLLDIKDNLLSALVYGKMEVAKSHDISLSVKYLNAFETYPLQGYELVEVIGNLLDNSFEAILNSGKTDERKVILTIGTEEGKKILQVENTGKKIESKDIDKIFNKGFSTKSNSRGYGLYNVKKIATRYGGKILLPISNKYTTIKILF